MKNLWIAVDYVNKNEGYIIDRLDAYETMYSNKEELYKACVEEFGKPAGEVYIDVNGKEKPVGWIFEKPQKYEDTKKSFTLETWVTVYKSEPIKKITWEVEYA